MALHIVSTGAGAHAYIECYGLRWPRGTYEISARSRLGDLAKTSEGSAPPSPLARPAARRDGHRGCVGLSQHFSKFDSK